MVDLRTRSHNIGPEGHLTLVGQAKHPITAADQDGFS